MMNINRRTLLASAPIYGAALAVPTALAAAEPQPEPLLLLINRYHAALADYIANSPRDDDGADAYAEETFYPLLRELAEWSEPATTMAGALAALRLGHEEASNFCAGPGTCQDAMFAAGIAYLERRFGGEA